LNVPPSVQPPDEKLIPLQPTFTTPSSFTFAITTSSHPSYTIGLHNNIAKELGVQAQYQVYYFFVLLMASIHFLKGHI